ncbi:MAG: 16S rRNA (guanine(966)-N(2))-methyltransferase RsmD [Bacilli bacterium]|nr:16S rRNA (guanine(966)-N(2))-methyltransferase RsmD [Bacilli bacterium]
MRVISGFLKGRNIKGNKIKGTRPTMDKVKESLFAIIQNSVKDAICLDLFAGSGSLGIEAISNGASHVYFVDNSKTPYEIIKNNIKSLNIEDKTDVFLSDYMKALYHFKRNNIKFDLIFIDPPYKENPISDILTFIDENNLLHDMGQVICEFSTADLAPEYGDLHMIKERKYGDKTIKIYINKK